MNRPLSTYLHGQDQNPTFLNALPTIIFFALLVILFGLPEARAEMFMVVPKSRLLGPHTE
jgi:hypothetical protein